MKQALKRVVFVPSFALWCWPRPASALDTLEPFEPGLSDAELYTGAENVGGGRADSAVFFSGGFGAGLTDELSLFLGQAATGDGYMSQSTQTFEALLYAGVGTWGPVSLDLGATAADGDASIQAGPYFELNWDHAPDQALVGVYLHGGPTAAGADDSVDFTWEHGLGGYYTVREDLQLLLEWVTGYDLGRKPAHRAWQRGSLLMGANWQITDSLELLADAGTTIPHRGAPLRAQASLGFIATLTTPH